MTAPDGVHGDTGIGLCLVCVLEHRSKTEARKRDKKVPPPRPPLFAITQAPFPYPVPAPGGGIAGIAGVPLPVCYDHSPLPGGPPQQPRLVVASGGMP